jgi:hypothetical protein
VIIVDGHIAGGYFDRFVRGLSPATVVGCRSEALHSWPHRPQK